jgi:GAF domain-containing protein
MSPSKPEASASRPINNAVTASDWSPGDGEPGLAPYAAAVDRALRLVAELARNLIGAHQGAAAMLTVGNWGGARKWFSLSDKYANWFAYRAPAAGVGLHAMVVDTNAPVRLTQAQVEAHPAYRGFGLESPRHPPMRGWLAVPIVGRDGTNHGLLQVSDKYNDADFTPDDEAHLTQLAQLTAITLDALSDTSAGDPSSAS